MSKLNRIDDDFCVRHDIARALLAPFAARHGNESADILLLSERPHAGSESLLSAKHAAQWELGNLKQQLDATGIQPSRICVTSLLPQSVDGDYQPDSGHRYQQQAALGCERLLQLVAAMPRLRSVVLLGQEVQRALESITCQLDDYQLLCGFDTDKEASGGSVQPLSVHYYQYCRNMELLEYAYWGQDLVLARTCSSTEVVPDAPAGEWSPA